MKNPKVSVVIPTCNRPDLISRAIHSVLAQTFRDFEIIVVDDGMKVRSQDVVVSFDDSRIRYIQNEVSLGGGGTRNRGIEESLGEYVAFLDDDDEWLPTKLEKQVRGLDESGAGVGAAFVAVAIHDETTGEKLRDFRTGLSGVVDIFDQTLYRCFIWTSAIMVKRSVLLEEQFDPAFKKNQEWDLQLRIAQKYKFFGVDEALTKINILPDDKHMGGKGNTPNIARGFEQLMEKYRSDLEQAPMALARHSFTLGGLYRDLGRFKDMRKMFFVAWKSRPTMPAYFRHYVLSLLGERVYMVLYRLLR